jgi:hypothetical protein
MKFSNKTITFSSLHRRKFRLKNINIQDKHKHRNKMNNLSTLLIWKTDIFQTSAIFAFLHLRSVKNTYVTL